MGLTFFLPALDLARVCDNTVPFLPARAVNAAGFLTFENGYLIGTATDSYTAGRDWCRYTGEGGEGPITVGVTQKGLKEIAKAARADKKGQARVTVHPGDALILTDTDGVDTAAPLTEPDLPLLDAVNYVFEQVKDRNPGVPHRLMLDPALLMRFSHVKADKSERMADLLILGPDSPVFVKIGPTFQGLIAPIDREQNAKTAGDDGLW